VINRRTDAGSEEFGINIALAMTKKCYVSKLIG
jgi:hypothetical protein